MATRMNSQQRLVLTIAVLGSFVAFLDGTVVNVALPAISNELGGGLTTQQWTIDAYLITLGALMLVAGAVSDAYGRLLVLRIGLIGFGITSVATAAAPTVELLIAARAAQGAAGAFLVPSSLALITSTMQEPVRSRAIGMWTAMTTAATIAGPLIGGLIVDTSSWRFVFLINVIPIGLALWLLPKLKGADARVEGATVDWWGAVLCVAGLGLAVLALIELPAGGPPQILIPVMIAGILLFIGFLWRQRVARSPLMPLSLFRNRTFASGNLATFFIYAALSLNSFVVSIFLQQGAGLSATLAGLASLPTTILMVLLSSPIGVLSGRIGPRAFMTVGPIIMAAGVLLLLTVAEDFNYWWQVLPAMCVMGVGLAITVSPLTSAILGAVDGEHSGVASAVNNAVSRVAGLLAIAGIAAITGGALDLAGFHRATIFTAVFLVIGGIVSAIGVRNPPASTSDAKQPQVAPH